MPATSHSPHLAAASPPVLPTLSALTEIPSDRSHPMSISSPTQWLPMTPRSGLHLTLRWREVDSNHWYRVMRSRFREGVISVPPASHQPKGSTNESRHHGNAGGSCAVLMVRIRLPPAKSRANRRFRCG